MAGYSSTPLPKKLGIDEHAVVVLIDAPKGFVASDLSESVVREVALAHGLVDYKVCAIDATWSGLKFVVRGEKARTRATITKRVKRT